MSHLQSSSTSSSVSGAVVMSAPSVVVDEALFAPEPKERDERWDLRPRQAFCRIGDKRIEVEIRDVSDAGCLVSHDGELQAAGTSLTLEIPRRWFERPVMITGTVRWSVRRASGQCAIGLRFAEGLDEAARLLVFELLVRD